MEAVSNATQAQIEAAVKENRDAVFDALKKLGASAAIVEYSGSGDSGQMNGVLALTASSEELPLHQTELIFNEVSDVYAPGPDGDFHRQVSISPTNMDLASAINSYCWRILEERHEGWENDDGGNGSFTFNVEDGTIDFEHNEAYVEYNTSTYEV